MERITDLKEIQSIELEILKYIDKLCRENDIKYSLCAGSALGAVRHKGFIPWDDDIDIMMLREDYEKFLKIADNIKDDKYKLVFYSKEHPNFYGNLARMVDKTTFIDDPNPLIQDKDYGLFVDIFPIDMVVSKNYFKKYWRYRELKHLASVRKFKKGQRGGVFNFFKPFAWVLARMFGYKFWYKKSMNLIRKIPKKTTKEKCEYMAIYGAYGMIEIMPKQIFDEFIDIEFGGLIVPIIKDYDVMLTTLYGDYMQLPPKDKQVPKILCDIYRR